MARGKSLELRGIDPTPERPQRVEVGGRPAVLLPDGSVYRVKPSGAWVYIGQRKVIDDVVNPRRRVR